MTATGTGRAKSNPAELNDELHDLLDIEMGHPRRRTTADRQARTDEDAVPYIAERLRWPVWDSELLEEICDIIRDTGRPVGGAPLVVIAS